MKKNAYNYIIALFITLPLAFILIFLGFFPPRFDVVVYTDNIIGEGICSSYLTDTNTSFSYLYKANAYFGSELKTLRLSPLAYNVDSICLNIYDVEEADIVSFDVDMFGRTITHVSIDGLTHPFTASTKTAVITDEKPLAHLVKTESNEGMSMTFPGNSLIPIYIWIAYGCFIFLLAGGMAVAVSALIMHRPKTSLILMNAATVMITMIMGCFLCGSLPYVSYTYFLLNWLMMLAVSLLINSLTLPWIGTVLVSILSLFWYVANHFVIQFRSKPIMPADLKALGTAKEVMGGYNLSLTWQILVSIVVVLCYITSVILIWIKTRSQDRKPLKKQLIYRSIGVVAAVAVIFFDVNNPMFSRLNTFQWDAKVLEGFHREGIVLTFVKSAISAHVDKPTGYSREIVESYLQEYCPEPKNDAIHPTRIIMVMNEAFSDLRTVGLDESIDVMPFVDSLNTNTIEGNLYVSVIGGGTCNTEFEALTGNTLAFLASGAYPYTENVTEPLFSLASYFRDNGYITEAFHASNDTNWNRNTVYPNIGFDVFHSIVDYPNISEENYLHGYIMDATDYAFIKHRDKEMTNHPRFLFNVTIQNHSDYDHFLDVKEAETLKAHEDLTENVRVYLSLIKTSDDAIRQLVEFYSNSEEPTMIVFFGDHQPSLTQEAYQGVYTNVNKYLDLFKSKFFIWTNYNTETQHDTEISANYLPLLILERGNFPLPPYVQMLREVHEKYPILSSQGVIDIDGNVYENVAVLADDPLIQKYQYIQYANLFDELDPAWFEVQD